MKKTTILVAVSSMLASGGTWAKSKSDPLELEWSVETGIGYETNAFHASDHTYIDYYADPAGTVVVTPVEQGGFFIPLKVKTEIVKPESKKLQWKAKYFFSGDFFPSLSDANSTYNSLSLGADMRMGKKRNRAEAYAGVFAHSLQKVYVDRDNGIPKTSSSGVGVSNRYTYNSFGVEGDYERRLTRETSVGVEGQLENRDYEDPIAWSQYDHTSITLATYLEHEFSKKLDGDITFEVETEDYSDRRSYNASGSLLTSNPLLTYTYTTLEIGTRYRVRSGTYLYLDYEREQRRDNNVGYNNMTQNTWQVRLSHDVSDYIEIGVDFEVYDRDYPNAFNFEDPARGSKSASGTSFEFRGEYAWSEHKTYFVELARDDRRNTDDRYQYKNNVVMLGAKWDY